MFELRNMIMSHVMTFISSRGVTLGDLETWLRETRSNNMVAPLDSTAVTHITSGDIVMGPEHQQVRVSEAQRKVARRVTLMMWRTLSSTSLS